MAAPITIVQANKQSDEETCLLVEAPPPAVIHELKDSPLEWSLQYKWIVVVLLESMTCLDIFATIAIVPAVPQIFQELHVNNPLFSILVVSIWELGEGIGPFVVAPLSELYGRLLVYHAGNTLFTLCLMASARSTSISALIALRFLNGLTTSCLTLEASIIGDIFVQEQRGRAMAVALLFRMIGMFGAPLFGGYVAQEKGWRWVIGIVAIAVGLLHVISLIFLRETYAPILLQRQSKPNDSVEAHNSLKKNEQIPAWRLHSLLRPLRMLCASPTLSILSFYTAISYGLGYLLMTTMTPIFRSLYGLSLTEVGWVFAGRPIGNILGIALYGLLSDRHLASQLATHGTARPETRLLFTALGSIGLPIGFLAYGLTLTLSSTWVLPVAATAIVGFSTALIQLPVQNYLVDAFSDYAASAVAVSVIMMASSGAFVPLVAPPLYGGLGYGWGNMLLGVLAAGFVPVMVVTYWYGHRVRGDRRRWAD